MIITKYYCDFCLKELSCVSEGAHANYTINIRSAVFSECHLLCEQCAFDLKDYLQNKNKSNKKEDDD